MGERMMGAIPSNWPPKMKSAFSMGLEAKRNGIRREQNPHSKMNGPIINTMHSAWDIGWEAGGMVQA